PGGAAHDVEAGAGGAADRHRAGFDVAGRQRTAANGRHSFRSAGRSLRAGRNASIGYRGSVSPSDTGVPPLVIRGLLLAELKLVPAVAAATRRELGVLAVEEPMKGRVRSLVCAVAAVPVVSVPVVSAARAVAAVARRIVRIASADAP